MMLSELTTETKIIVKCKVHSQFHLCYSISHDMPQQGACRQCAWNQGNISHNPVYKYQRTSKSTSKNFSALFNDHLRQISCNEQVMTRHSKPYQQNICSAAQNYIQKSTINCFLIKDVTIFVEFFYQVRKLSFIQQVSLYLKNWLFLITTQFHCYLALPLLQKVHTGSGAHPASCSVGVGVL
jgi:hypothetical protein